MTWLGGWLREIILVVLLAAFVEMLLPSKSMERYARLVLSLLVLLTMLSPIVSLLKGDAASELSVAIAKQEKDGGLLSGAKQGDDSLQKILADGQMLAKGRQEQSLKLAAQEVAGQMRDQITSETGVRGAQVTVKLGMGKAADATIGQEVPVISSVSVSLPATTGGATGTSSPTTTGTTTAESIVIPPVEAVQITVETTPDTEETGTAAGAGTEAANGSNKADNHAADEADSIIKLLEQKWDLAPGVIQVQGNSSSDTKL
ncbi:stage III sporulation protein AF [Paenibacillus sp. 19GGS1-52]|uniref:stage III sporulation protein AF n=1 Tax=Paenibacillus sp. 19GGS1-52 TaxID=2758563 RepID=UPI001EFAAA8B|nr:stage III sporulation protein AF [Paenibacillus sp. 19GGS1-52]ULO09142.1 stage III sporulation protein AF [Paenibacillus sp. 19GGS1-52]